MAMLLPPLPKVLVMMSVTASGAATVNTTFPVLQLVAPMISVLPASKEKVSEPSVVVALTSGVQEDAAPLAANAL